MPPDELAQWCGVDGESGPERTPVAHHILTRAAPMLISWSELFKCDRLDTTGTNLKHCLWYQMMIPVYEVSADGQSYQMQHWDRVEWVLLPHECRLPGGGHFENVGELSQCCAVDDMLIERLHTDGELLDDLQAAHIQCVLQVWIRKKGSKQACHSRLPFTWLFVAVKRLNWLEICSISVHQNPAGAWNIVHTNQSVMCD